jgi:thioredoxin-like negative regulator of GroEL
MDVSPSRPNDRVMAVHRELGAEESLAAVLDELDGLVLEVDSETHPGRADAFDVTTTPTLLVVADGDAVQRREGLPDRQGCRELVAPWT